MTIERKGRWARTKSDTVDVTLFGTIQVRSLFPVYRFPLEIKSIVCIFESKLFPVMANLWSIFDGASFRGCKELWRCSSSLGLRPEMWDDFFVSSHISIVSSSTYTINIYQISTKNSIIFRFQFKSLCFFFISIVGKTFESVSKNMSICFQYSRLIHGVYHLKKRYWY